MHMSWKRYSNVLHSNYCCFNKGLFAHTFSPNLENHGHKEKRHAMLKALRKHENKVKQKQRKQFSSLYTEP